MSESLALRTLPSVSGFAPWRMVAAVLYTHAQPPTANLGTGRSASERAGLRWFTRATVRAWCFANDIVRALLAVRRQSEVSEVVAGQTLVAGDSNTLENREGEAWQPTHMDFIGSQNCGDADGIIVRKFDMRDLFISVILELVDDHCQHLGDIVEFARSTPPLPFRWQELVEIFRTPRS